MINTMIKMKIKLMLNDLVIMNPFDPTLLGRESQVIWA